jgi:hypothetical protein
MLQDVRRVLVADPATVAREAAGLAGVCVAIIAVLLLPLLA